MACGPCVCHLCIIPYHICLFDHLYPTLNRPVPSAPRTVPTTHKFEKDLFNEFMIWTKKKNHNFFLNMDFF